jgi:hypothetical protein
MKELDKMVDAMIHESKQRFKWYFSGINIHCLSLDLFSKISTERLCELYNVEMSFFKN